MSKQSIILLAIALILGIYLLGSIISSLLKGKQVEFNIGCFIVDHSLNRTHQLLHRIQDMQHAENMSHMQLALHQQPIADPTDFHNKSVQLAMSFEKYIKKLTQQHDYNMENVQILREVSKAEKEYLSCKKEIDLSYSQADCTDNWRQYANCSLRMNLMRSKLERLTQEESLLQDQIAQIIKMPNKVISALDLAKQLYNDSMKANERVKEGLSQKLNSLQRELRGRVFERDEAFEKSELTLRNFRECEENKKKHNACEQISKEVRNINSQNIAYLKVMMESKQELLRNLQRILESQKNSKEIEELNEKYLKHKDEFINMHREFVSLTLENEKACGCTTELELDLKKELETLKRRQISLNADILTLEQQIRRVEDEMEKNDEEREDIVRRYKKALEDDENNPKEAESPLSKMNRDLKGKYSQVLSLRGLYRNIEGECQRLKEAMGLRVHDISKINECISKKNYFLELKRQTAPYLHSDKEEQSRMLNSKRELAYYLSSFVQ